MSHPHLFKDLDDIITSYLSTIFRSFTSLKLIRSKKTNMSLGCRTVNTLNTFFLRHVLLRCCCMCNSRESRHKKYSSNKIISHNKICFINKQPYISPLPYLPTCSGRSYIWIGLCSDLLQLL